MRRRSRNEGEEEEEVGLCNIYVFVSLSVWMSTEPSKAVLLWIIFVIYFLCLSCFCVCSLLPCVHRLGTG